MTQRCKSCSRWKIVGFIALASNGNLFAGYFRNDGLRHTHNDLFQSGTETASKGVADEIYGMGCVTVYKSSVGTILHVYLPAKKLKKQSRLHILED